MSGISAVLFTRVGGILGAGLTQYVTRIQDRRIARASVIERVHDIEEALVELRWPCQSKSAEDIVENGA